MRIIAGTLKGRRFDPPITTWKTRPTTDFAKEALFNLLENRFDLDEVNALDLFAGTGNISFELLSRGCPSVTAVEKFGAAVAYMSQLSRTWQVEDRLQVVKMDVRRFLEQNRSPFHLIFSDPPYDLPWRLSLPDLVIGSTAFSKGSLLVIEHSNKDAYESHPHFLEQRTYGQSAFSFFTG